MLRGRFIHSVHRPQPALQRKPAHQPNQNSSDLCLEVVFTQFLRNTGRDGGLSLCQRVSVARRSGISLGEEEEVLLQGDQGPGFSFSAQVIPGHCTWITHGEWDVLLREELSGAPTMGLLVV